MTKKMLKTIAVGAASVALILPFVALAQINSESLGLGYAQATGLGTQDVRTTISGVIKAFMGLLGIVAVVIILLGGFKWMIAAGNEEKVSEAKKLIISGVIGLVIILSAYAIAQFVIGAILAGTSNP